MNILGYDIDHLVDELPASGRLLITDSVSIDGEDYYATIVQTRARRVYCQLRLVAAVRQSLIDSGWITS